MASDGDVGCGCVVVFVILCILGGGIVEGLALAGAAWLGYLVFVGVSIGIVVAIAKAIAGE
jgi:hypothetical protein